MCKIKDAIINGEFPVSQKQIDSWYTNGQRKTQVNLGVPPKTSTWEKYVIWGKKEAQGREFAKQQGLM